MRIIQNLVDKSKWNIKCPYSMDAKFIVVHNTANDAPAWNEISYMINNNNETSFHYAVDGEQVIQGILETRNAWHCGNTYGNRNGIGIEICYSLSGGNKFTKAEENAVKFIAEKLKEKNWDISKVKKHQDFSGKYCPHRTLDLGWERFLNMVREELGELPTPETEPDKEKISVDGIWGKATTKKAQEILGTPADGIIDDQMSKYKEYLLEIDTASWKFENGSGGSMLIKALQKKIGATADGYFGVATIKALQKFVGASVDGYMGNETITKFQEWLNKQ